MLQEAAARRIIRRKVDLKIIGEVLRPLRIWSSLPNLARATLLNMASSGGGGGRRPSGRGINRQLGYSLSHTLTQQRPVTTDRCVYMQRNRVRYTHTYTHAHTHPMCSISISSISADGHGRRSTRAEIEVSPSQKHIIIPGQRSEDCFATVVFEYFYFDKLERIIHTRQFALEFKIY